MERVTLRNGMTVDCERHENLGDQLRLYTGPGKAYQDVSFLQIVSIEYVPGSPAQVAPKPIALPHPLVAAAKAAPAVFSGPKAAAPTAAAAPAAVSVKAGPGFMRGGTRGYTPAPGYAHAPAPMPVPLYAAPKPATIPVSPSAVAAVPPAFPEMAAHDLLQRAGSTYNIDTELLASIIHAESGGNARATSRFGARGLMQLMPSVGRLYGATDLYRPEENVTAGTAFLDALLRKYNDNLPLALAAYNAGPGAVARYHGVPPVTRGYVSRVMGEFYRRKLAMGAKPGATAVVKIGVAAAPVPKMATAPTQRAAAGSTKSGMSGMSGGSIHPAWSGQQSFARR